MNEALASTTISFNKILNDFVKSRVANEIMFNACESLFFCSLAVF